MPNRVIVVDGESWTVEPSGRTTQYVRDEFSLLFTRGHGPDRERRVTRYSPPAARDPEGSLDELTDQELGQLLTTSEPAWISPETGYQR